MSAAALIACHVSNAVDFIAEQTPGATVTVAEYRAWLTADGYLVNATDGELAEALRAASVEECPECGGEGHVEHAAGGWDEPRYGHSECPACGGSGEGRWVVVVESKREVA